MKEDAYRDGLLAAHLAQSDDDDWIYDRSHELMNDRNWLCELDISDLDNKNWQKALIGLTQLPILLVQNLSKLAPHWRSAIKEYKDVDQLIEIADTLYELIENKARNDAQTELEEMRIQYEHDKAQATSDWDD